MMVQPAESRQGLNLAFTRRADFRSPTCWRVLRESKMSPVLVIVEQVGRHQPSLREQSQQLPTESEVFEDEVRPTTERTDQPAEEMPERHDHGKNFSGKDRIKLCVKSLISQVYDHLARHSGRSLAG